MNTHTVILFLLNILVIIRFAYSDISYMLVSENHDEINRKVGCILKLYKKHFVQKKAQSGSIVIMQINSFNSTIGMSLLKTIQGSYNYSVMMKDSHYVHAPAQHFLEKPKNYMLILEEKSELSRHLQELSKLRTWSPWAKTFVFYPLKIGENAEEISIEFINELREKKLLKSIINIYLPKTEEVIAYSWKPYSDTNCGGKCKSVYILDKCSDGKLQQYHEQKEYFPLNLRGCPLVVYAVVSEPYVMPPEKKSYHSLYNDEYSFDKGGDISLVKTISEFTNMTLIVRTSDVPENWGKIYQNGTATAAYGFLRTDEIDIVIGNIEVSTILRYWFHPTVIITQDEMTWCVPQAGKASNWNSVAIIFQWTTWLTTLISLIVLGLIFHFCYYKQQDEKITKWPTKSLLMTLGMLLGWGSSFRPKSAAFRILILSWLIFSLNIAISYDSSLRSFLMHTRYEKQIETEQELIESGITIGGRDVYQLYFGSVTASSSYFYKNYYSTLYSDGIKRTAIYRDFAIVSSRNQAEYQDQMLGKGKPLIYCFRKSNILYKYGVVFVTRRWFPFLERFNKIIRSVSENGLIDKWNQKVSSFKDNEEKVVPLGIQHVLGVFFFIGFMYIISFLVLLIELLSDFCKRRKLQRVNLVLNISS